MPQTKLPEAPHCPKSFHPSPWPKPVIENARNFQSVLGEAARLALTFLFAATLLVATCASVHAQTLTTLYSFTGHADGASPNGDLIIDTAGNLYGTTAFGGNLSNCKPNSCGVIFKITTSGQEQVLHPFLGGLYGGETSSGLIADAQGNLYGETGQYGKNGFGTVFELVPTTGRFRVFYSFAGKPDGQEPVGRIVRDSQGNLYGTTMLGGSRNRGSVYKVTSSGVETVLHSFVLSTDGDLPAAGVVRDSQGNLYGTTASGGGAFNAGTVYKVVSGGKESILYSFSAEAMGKIHRLNWSWTRAAICSAQLTAAVRMATGRYSK